MLFIQNENKCCFLLLLLFKTSTDSKINLKCEYQCFYNRMSQTGEVLNPVIHQALKQILLQAFKTEIHN